MLRHLRQRGPFPEASIVHGIWAASALPANLLNPIVKLILMAIGVAEVHVPISARHITTNANDLDALGIQVVASVYHFAKRSYLPRELIDRHLARCHAHTFRDRAM